jgi:uncharacterized protein YjiS (DUF1127 family)
MSGTIETKLDDRRRLVGAARVKRKQVRRFLAKILETLVIWQERADQRHALRDLNPHLLKDIGISRADAYREARKPFWRP